MSGVQMTNVNKRFDAVHVIHDVNLDIEPGEFTVFVGPSGCGKSTLLRMVAGLEDISGGEMKIGGVRVNDVDPANRGIAMVFQSYALYPHMTVEDNMGFGLRMAGMPRADIHARVMKAAKILQLDLLLDRLPKALSGGQRQRVAIGRAIVRDPQVFLFDEPLSNLDAELRVETRVQIAKLHQDLGATMIYVTHDQVEAMTLADKIVVLRAGRVEQVGSPLNLYDNPNNKFVAGFIGSPKMNFLDARAGAFADGKLGVELTRQGGVTVSVPLTEKPPAPGATLSLGIRPEHFVEATGDTVTLDLKAEVTEHLGGASFIHASFADGERLVIEQRGFRDTKPGDKVPAAFRPENVMLFDENEARLR